MYFDRFDICEGYYCYAVEHHQGQWSKAYALFGRLINMGFNPSLSIKESGSDSLTENGKDIYNNLVEIDY